MPEVRTASIKGRREDKKRKFVPSSFSAKRNAAHFGCAAASETVQIDSVGRRGLIARRIRANPTCGSSNQGPLSAVPKSIG
jgi:hypothetical protein